MEINIDCAALSVQDSDSKIEYLKEHFETLSMVCGERCFQYALKGYFKNRGRIVIERKALYQLVESLKLD